MSKLISGLKNQGDTFTKLKLRSSESKVDHLGPMPTGCQQYL